MTTMNEIEHAVSSLSPEDLSRFRDWFFEFDARLWDRKLEADVAAGRLDALAAEALAITAPGEPDRRDTPRQPTFLQEYARLPPEVQRLADENCALLKPTPAIPPCTSRKSVDSGPHGSARIIEHSLSSRMVI